MVTKDIEKGWKWLRSLPNEEWRREINEFFVWYSYTFKQASTRFVPVMNYGFDRWPQLRKDIEREYEEELSTWFCEADVKMERV